MKKGQKTNTSEIQRLVRASQAGDRCAFDKLVRLYQRRATKVALRLSGDVNQAVEAVQQGFINAYLKIGKIKDPGRFEMWLLRIVTNAAISQQRAAAARIDNLEIVDDRQDNKTVSPVDNTVAGELKEAIQKAMTKLSKKEAKAIALFGLEDLSQKQVAEIMGCSVAVVRWNVFSARKKLKVLLKEFL